MGAFCCVAARDTAIPDQSIQEIVHRNVQHSPTWSFRWDHRGRVAGEVETSLSSLSDRLGRNNGLEIKSTDSQFISEMGSPLESLPTPISQKSPISEEAAGKATAPFSGQSLSASDLSPIKLLSLASSTFSSPSAPNMPPPGLTPSRWPWHSSGHQTLGQISDGRIRRLKSWNNYSISEGRPSLVKSHGGSSDSDSFDDDIIGSCSQNSTSPSLDLWACGVCSKPLTEKFTAVTEISSVAVLICGHVFHAECLEKMTPEINKYDPGCPVCTKKTFNSCKKAWKAEIECKAKATKRLRNQVVDSDFDGDFIEFGHCKSNGSEWKGSKMGSGSSMKGSLGKPFLKRHFSFGSKGIRSFSENQTTRKKGISWTRSSRE